MNLLNYTKILSKKISYYDRLACAASEFTMSNPFAWPVDRTVIWVENCNEKEQK